MGIPRSPPGEWKQSCFSSSETGRQFFPFLRRNGGGERDNIRELEDGYVFNNPAGSMANAVQFERKIKGQKHFSFSFHVLFSTVGIISQMDFFSKKVGKRSLSPCFLSSVPLLPRESTQFSFIFLKGFVRAAECRPPAFIFDHNVALSQRTGKGGGG